MYHDPYRNNNPQQYGGGHYGVQGQPYPDAPPPTQQTYYNQNHVQEVNSIKPQNPSNGGMCRDWPFAILFIANLIAIAVCFFMWGLDAVKDGNDDRTTTSFMSTKDKRNCILLACGFSVIAVICSLASVKLIVAYARCMINFTLWFNVAVAFALAAYGFGIGNYVLGVIGGILALLTLCYVRAVQHRIPFAVANLRVAEAAISKHWSTYIVSIVFTMVQVGWVVLWFIAFLGVANQLKETKSNGLPAGSTCVTSSDCSSLRCGVMNQRRQCIGSSPSGFRSSGSGYATYFFLVLSFYWGLQVCKNLSHTTIAGTVASFWYNAESGGATGSSLKRSMTTSFGSICFGSLLVAIIQALRAMAEQARSEGSFAACIADCILGCLQSIMEYINRWAFVYVGIYGYKFTQAGKAVFQLFAQRGFDMIINDDLIGNVLGFASLAVGLICAAVGAYIAHSTTIVSFENANIVLPLLGLFVGVGVAITPLSVIDGSVATIFVCFAEDPVAFQQSHPDLYLPLVTEWHNLYPEIMVQAGYWRS